MTKAESSKRLGLRDKRYDLEERTFEFAKRCRDFVRRLSKSLSRIEYAKQLIRSSGSVAANYIEANESLVAEKISFSELKFVERRQKKRVCGCDYVNLVETTIWKRSGSILLKKQLS